MFKFLHAADIHLDSPLRGLSRYPGAPVDLLRTATREAFANLVDIAIREQVAFVVIAGDLYDGDWKDFNTGIYFAAQMGRLREAGIRVVVAHGNHDAESQISRTLRPPDNVHIFGARKAETTMFRDLRVALHGQSFRDRDTTENLVPGYPDPVPGFLNVGVLHTSLEGYSEHAAYAPCSLDELSVKGYSYWALGHVHHRQILSENPYIVFPGNLQGRNIRERGAKGAMLVVCEDEQIAHVEPVYVDVVRWARVIVDAARATDFLDVVDRVHQAIEAAVGRESDGGLLAVRVIVNGRTQAHGAVLRDEDRLKAEVRAVATGLGDEVAWVEKIEISTEPELDAEVLRDREDAVGELQRMLDEASEDEALIAEIQSELAEMMRKLPSEIRSDPEVEAMAAVKEGRAADLVRDVVPFLAARVMSLES